jgi:hypothetical protein
MWLWSTALIYVTQFKRLCDANGHVARGAATMPLTIPSPIRLMAPCRTLLLRWYLTRSRDHRICQSSILEPAARLRAYKSRAPVCGSHTLPDAVQKVSRSTVINTSIFTRHQLFVRMLD